MTEKATKKNGFYVILKWELGGLGVWRNLGMRNHVWWHQIVTFSCKLFVPIYQSVCTTCKLFWKAGELKSRQAKVLKSGRGPSLGWYGKRIGNHTQAFEWHQFQWPWETSKPVFKVTYYSTSNNSQMVQDRAVVWLRWDRRAYAGNIRDTSESDGFASLPSISAPTTMGIGWRSQVIN